MKKLLTALFLTGSLASCSTDPELNKTYIGAGIGTLAGVATGLLAGDDADERLRYALAGAGVGAATGAGVGYYMDQQETEFKQTLQAANNELAQQSASYQQQIDDYQNQIRIEREANDILINMPAAVTFDSGKSALKPSFNGPLNSIASILQKYNQTNIVITGHTDSDGSMEYNQKLSEDRATSVGLYLLKNGIVRDRISIQGAGEALPVASNANAAGKAQNRRVEMRILPSKDLQAQQQQQTRQQIQPQQVQYQAPRQQIQYQAPAYQPQIGSNYGQPINLTR